MTEVYRQNIRRTYIDVHGAPQEAVRPFDAHITRSGAQITLPEPIWRQYGVICARERLICAWSDGLASEAVSTGAARAASLRAHRELDTASSAADALLDWRCAASLRSAARNTGR